MIEVSLTNEQKVQITINPVTATGKPAKLDGAPKWTVQSGNSTLDVSVDGLSAFIVTADGDIGDSVVLVDADADLGAGVVDISDLVTCHVSNAMATNLGLSAATPVPK